MTATVVDTLTVREYLRVSKDTSGRERSNDEQHAANVAAIEANPGLVLSDLPAYRDVGSASSFGRKVRVDFAALMADLRDGTFGADALMLWECSRGSRRVSEWVTLLEVAAEVGVSIIVTTHGPRMYDPSNDRDWRSLIEDAVDSEYEVRKTSKRVGRNMAASAEAGAVPGGRRAFGYTSDNKLHADEAPVVVDLVARLLAGASVRELAAWLNAEGIKTSAGNAWHPGVLKGVLGGPRIAGIRVHKDREVAKGVWPAIIDEDTHRRVVAMLSSRTPVGRRGRTPWLLTGLLRCERCGSSLVGNTRSATKVRVYTCRKAPGYNGCGGLTIKAEPVEVLLGDHAAAALVDVEARRNASATAANDAPELADLNRIAAQRIEVADARAAGTLSLASAAEEYAALDRRQKAVEATLAAKVRETSPLDYVFAEGFAGAEWSDLDIPQRRLILSALIDHVTIGPATVQGSTKFEAARVVGPGRIAWKV